MKYTRITERCLDSLEGEFESFERRLLPLISAHGDALVSSFVEIGDLNFEWYTFNLDTYVSEAYVGDDLRISIPVAAEHAPTYFGTPMEPYHGYLSLRGWEHHYLIREGCTGLGINIPQQIVRLMGWSGYMDVRHDLPRDARDHLVWLCKYITRLAKTGGLVRSEPDMERILHDALLIAIDRIIKPWRMESRSEKRRLFEPHTRYEVFRHASEILTGETDQTEYSVNSRDLARKLGISRSSMFDVFRKSIGIGPTQYLLIIRLHRFRTDLINARNTGKTVSFIAHDNGFSQLGRLAAQYRDYFGELPSETLRRSG